MLSFASNMNNMNTTVALTIIIFRCARLQTYAHLGPRPMLDANIVTG